MDFSPNSPTKGLVPTIQNDVLHGDWKKGGSQPFMSRGIRKNTLSFPLILCSLRTEKLS